MATLQISITKNFTAMLEKTATVTSSKGVKGSDQALGSVSSMVQCCHDSMRLQLEGLQKRKNAVKHAIMKIRKGLPSCRIKGTRQERIRVS